MRTAGLFRHDCDGLIGFVWGLVGPDGVAFGIEAVDAGAAGHPEVACVGLEAHATSHREIGQRLAVEADLSNGLRRLRPCDAAIRVERQRQDGGVLEVDLLWICPSGLRIRMRLMLPYASGCFASTTHADPSRGFTATTRAIQAND